MKISNKEKSILLEALYLNLNTVTSGFTKSMDTYREDLDLLYKLRQ